MNLGAYEPPGSKDHMYRIRYLGVLGGRRLQTYSRLHGEQALRPQGLACFLTHYLNSDVVCCTRYAAPANTGPVYRIVLEEPISHIIHQKLNALPFI